MRTVKLARQRGREIDVDEAEYRDLVRQGLVELEGDNPAGTGSEPNPAPSEAKQRGSVTAGPAVSKEGQGA